MSEKLKINTSHWVIIIALLAAAYACYLLIEPYVNSIVMAFIISLLMFPIHEWLEKKLPNKENIVSLLSCVILTFIIVIPLLAVFAAIVQQGSLFSQNTYQWVTHGGIQTLFEHPLVVKALSFANNYLPFDNIEPKPSHRKSENSRQALVLSWLVLVRKSLVMRPTS